MALLSGGKKACNVSLPWQTGITACRAGAQFASTLAGKAHWPPHGGDEYGQETRMRKVLAVIGTGMLLCTALMAAPALAETAKLQPLKIPGGQMPTAIFSSPQAKATTSENGVKITDVMSLHSADKKFMTGVYKVVGKHSDPIPAEGYAVDEFMYFIEGGVTLTSEDGTVTEARAGDAISIPKGWKGRWDSNGYTKYYVIYNRDGPVE
jgi:ethanolamine utilization protein EutQ